MILVEYTYVVHPPCGGTVHKRFRKVFFLPEQNDALNKLLSTLEDVPNVTIRELKEEKI